MAIIYRVCNTGFLGAKFGFYLHTNDFVGSAEALTLEMSFKSVTIKSVLLAMYANSHSDLKTLRGHI